METYSNFPASLALGENTFLKKISSQLKQLFRTSKKEHAVSKSHKKMVLFLVDDDPLYLKALELSISSYMDSLIIYTFKTGEACLQQMKQKPAIIILDYYLNSEVPYAWNGMAILKQIKKLSPKTKVVMLSSQDSLNVAIDCMENGAYDYISKTQTALVRINNLITNISGDTEVTSLFFKICEYIVLIILLAMVAYAILNH